MRLTLTLIPLATLALAQVHTRPPRPTPPTRDPHSPTYVQTRALPDTQVPPNQDGNYLLGPTHTPAPELAQFAALARGTPPQTLLAHGTVTEFTMNSADSTLYPGIARDGDSFGTPDPADPTKFLVPTSHPAGYIRHVAVYVPSQYVPGSAAPFIVGADGPDWMLFAALDNLIAAHRLPPIIGISIGNGGSDAQGSERGLEYDTMSGRYAQFVETEVLARVEAQAHVRLTHNPDGRATTGGSSGGACAMEMAWYRPDLYHRVLSYSGTFVNQQWPHSNQTPHGAWDFHEHLIPETLTKPLRIWIEVGDRDLLNPNPEIHDNMHDWVLANERMARVLAAKHYHYQFVFSEDAGHVDRGTRLQTLPEALEYVWAGYRAR
jgi:iron(III)-enterobactin esterase